MGTKLGPPGEFGPEHTGYMGDSTDWIGWEPATGHLLTSWSSASWPAGTTALQVHLDTAINGQAVGTYQESDLSQPQQLTSDLVIPADDPLFAVDIPGVAATVLVQVAPSGLSWWVVADSVADNPDSLHLQDGSTVSLMRQPSAPYVISAPAFVRTAFDPAV